MSQSSWLVGGILSGIERQPRKKLEPSPERLLALDDAHARADGIIENGFVHLPETAPWLAEYLHELAVFPNGQHDDQADSTAQFLDWILSVDIAGYSRLKGRVRRNLSLHGAFGEGRVSTCAVTVLQHRTGTPPRGCIKGLISLCEFKFQWGPDRRRWGPHYDAHS
jgi:hypothetical protein